MNNDYLYAIGQEVTYRGQIVRIKEREKGQFSGTAYYKVNGNTVWIKEESLSYYEPLAEWERALLEGARKFEIGARVQMKNSRKPGTVVKYDAPGKPLFPGVKWDDMTFSMSYDPNDLELHVPRAVEQIEGDDPRLEDFWKKAEAKARELGFCKEYDLIAEELRATKPKTEVKTVRMLVPVSVEVSVEVEVGKEPTEKQALEVLQGVNYGQMERELKRRAGLGYWNRGSAKLDKPRADF